MLSPCPNSFLRCVAASLRENRSANLVRGTSTRKNFARVLIISFASRGQLNPTASRIHRGAFHRGARDQNKAFLADDNSNSLAIPTALECICFCLQLVPFFGRKAAGDLLLDRAALLLPLDRIGS